MYNNKFLDNGNKEKTLKISYSTQKGGVGKSTMTTLLASILHYRLGFNVLVLDCDFPQHSLTNMRERDKKTLMQNEYHKKAAMKQFQTINKKAYPIIKSKAEYALEKASEYIGQSAIVSDVIFFDLPGTANTKGVLTTLKMMDFIFSPITADRLVVESTLGFTKAFLNSRRPLRVMMSKSCGCSGTRWMAGKKQACMRLTKVSFINSTCP